MNRTRITAALVTVISALICLSALPVSAASTTSSFGPGSNPILFVHGYSGSSSNWDTMVSKFEADGWPANYLDEWNYDFHQSNVTTAQQLANEVSRLKAATGASKVDVVTHSMGGLSSRYYLKNLQGESNVDKWVSLGGPNHGTTTADVCGDTSCAEMRIGSDFLNQLNAGDETPGAVGYGTWWSPCDEIINPHDSTVLSGASNTQTACLGHLALLIDNTVYGQVRDFVNS